MNIDEYVNWTLLSIPPPETSRGLIMLSAQIEKSIPFGNNSIPVRKQKNDTYNVLMWCGIVNIIVKNEREEMDIGNID